MIARVIGLVAGLLLAWGAFAPQASARERRGTDPWATDGGEQRRNRGGDEFDLEDDEEMMRRQGRWYPGNEEGPGPRLRRCAMNGLESAQYSVAELLLQRGDRKAAAAMLEDILAKSKDELLRDLTHINIAQIFRLQRDIEGAAKHYRQVVGSLRHAAARRLFTMYAEAGLPDEAAKITDELAAKAKEKGEKLALLHQLALAYRRHNMPDRALLIYQRIAKEFTPDDLAEMAKAVEREAKAAVAKLRRGEERGGPGMDRQRENLFQRRLNELQAAGRWDEAEAFEAAFQRGERDDERAPAEAEKGPDEAPKKAEF